MKFAVCLFALVAIVVAEPPVPSNQYLPANGFSQNGRGPRPQYGAPQQPNSQYGAPNGGNGEYDDNAPASYQFEYAVLDAETGNDFGHQESREGDVAQGKYYVLLPDGRKQTVTYTADNEGYKPMVTYEGGNDGYPSNGGNGGYPGGNGNGRNGNGRYRY